MLAMMRVPHLFVLILMFTMDLEGEIHHNYKTQRANVVVLLVKFQN